MRRQQQQENAQFVQANSRPFLQIDGNYSSRTPTCISLINAGIGPAKLERLKVFSRGQPIGDIHGLLEQCCGLPTDARRGG